METENPILTRYVDRGQTPRSNFSETHSARKIPPAIQKIIAELGLRYRPSAQADLEAHAATLALLCRDLADLPPHLLEQAARQWAVSSPYLPKASDLANLCRDMMQPAKRPSRNRDDWLRERAAEANRALADDGRIGAMMWVVDGAGMRLVDPKYHTSDRIEQEKAA